VRRSPSMKDAVDGRSRLRPTLVALCVTEITSWGVLYYAFPVLADSLSADTGWSKATTTAAFSISLLVAAGVGVPVGRMLDRLGPRWVMTAGSAVASGTVVGIALAPNLVVFFVVWIVAGVAMAAIFYQPAFAALTRWYGDDRIHALTVLTLAAGFSSTIFAPLTAALVSRSDWRTTYVILAVLLAVVTIPVHAWFLRPPWPDAPRPADSAVTGKVREILRSRGFVCLTSALALGAFAAFAVVFNLVPLLTGRGLSTETAAWALGLGGVGQVLGRTGYRRVVRTTTVTQRTVGILVAGAFAIAALGLLPGPPVALIMMAMVVGAIRGVSTLLQATAVSDRWGAEHYGTVSGVLTAPVMTAMAIAPWAGAALASAIGYPALFVVLAATGAAGALIAVWSRPSGTSEFETSTAWGLSPAAQQHEAVVSAVTDPSG
jgi:MFS family permease